MQFIKHRFTEWYTEMLILISPVKLLTGKPSADAVLSLPAGLAKLLSS